MLFLRCILGAILGAVGGFIAFIGVGVVMWAAVFLTTLDDSKATAVANFAIILLPAGIVIGAAIPLSRNAEKRRKNGEEKRQEAEQKQDELDAE